MPTALWPWRFVVAGPVALALALAVADIALDRSIERCMELGATNDFPEEPSP